MTTSLELAITAIRSGRREEGRQLLNLLIQQNPNNEMAWLWMSSVVDTDEQRARCLYHVLAIDPDNAVARQGLKVLGIIVSDSRPVKVPRDSQPIKIPKPSPQPQSGPLKALPEPQSTAQLAEERRAFRIDPQTIVDELPFTPVKAPFTQPLPPLSSAENAGSEKSEPMWVKRAKGAPQPKRQTGSLQNPSEAMPVTPLHAARPKMPLKQQPGPTPVAQAKIAPKIAPRQKSQPGPVVQPSAAQPVSSTNQQAQLQMAGQTEPMPTPSEPAPVQQSQPYQSAPADTGPLVAPMPTGQQPSSGVMPAPDTRPTPPMSMPQANVPVTPSPYYNNQPSPYGPATFYPNMPHSNVTMGMPHQAPMPQPYSQSMAALHSQATMGMLMTGQVAYPSGPMVHSNTTMGMPAVSYPPMQPQMPQNPALHSNSTMAMPPGQPNLVDYRSAQPAPPSRRSQTNKDEEDEEEEGINILAVIIFGSLSVTALGGLGMLILLMFASN